MLVATGRTPGSCIETNARDDLTKSGTRDESLGGDWFRSIADRRQPVANQASDQVVPGGRGMSLVIRREQALAASDGVLKRAEGVDEGRVEGECRDEHMCGDEACPLESALGQARPGSALDLMAASIVQSFGK